MNTCNYEFCDADQDNESITEDEDEYLENAGYLDSTREKLDTIEFKYDVLSTEQIVQHMIDCIREVNTVVQIPPTITRILLNHFKWDKQKLYERYYDGDQETLFEEVHVISPYKKLPNSSENSGLEIQSEECEICAMNISSNMMTGIACGHRFCKECWIDYLTSQIMDQGISQIITCAAHGCDILVDDQTVMSLITNHKVKLKYQHLITNSFVECNRLLRWCPQPGCDYAIAVQYAEAQPVTCECQHTFCFACGDNWHDPVKCSLLKRWQKQRGEDIKSLAWIYRYTKECPKCNVPIQKYGGCSYMVCKNKNCRHNFCWLCLKNLRSVTVRHSCNSNEEANNNLRIFSSRKSNATLHKFYYDRYEHHMQSLKFENLLYAKVKVKMEKMMQQQMSWIDVQFLKTAIDILCKCRQTLMYSYVFGHYSKQSNQFAIFEHNQSDLERATELLSEYLERDMTKENVLDIRQKVQDKYQYCESRCKALLDHVHEGYEERWWEFISPAETPTTKVLQSFLKKSKSTTCLNWLLRYLFTK